MVSEGQGTKLKGTQCWNEVYQNYVGAFLCILCFFHNFFYLSDEICA